MSYRRRLVVALVIGVAAAGALACAGGNSPSAPTTPPVTAVSITGTSSFSVGQSAQLTSTATLSNGTTQNVTSSATWASSNLTIATVSASGFLSAASAGEADIRATYQGVVGVLHVTVAALASANPAPTPSPTPSPTPTPTACGVERWAVKTLTDADATRVNFSDVIPTTITSLNGFPAHCSDLPDNRGFPEEFRVYEATGVVQLTRNEDDHDIHIALADPNDPTQTIVVEVVDPACATTSPYLSTLSQVRATYQSLGSLTGKTVNVRGVGFYDFAHGQTGRSRSCVELHPVIGISLANPPSPTPSPSPVPTPPPGSNLCTVTSPISAPCGTATAVCKDVTFSCSQRERGNHAVHLMRIDGWLHGKSGGGQVA